jgi:hypothetical protein
VPWWGVLLTYTVVAVLSYCAPQLSIRPDSPAHMLLYLLRLGVNDDNDLRDLFCVYLVTDCSRKFIVVVCHDLQNLISDRYLLHDRDCIYGAALHQ